MDLKTVWVRQTGENYHSPFVLANNKPTGFSPFSTNDVLEVTLAMGATWKDGLQIDYRIFSEDKEDVTTKYGVTFGDVKGNPLVTGSKISRMMLSRAADPKMHGSIMVYAWVNAASEFKIDPDDPRLKDLKEGYKAVKPVKILPPTPTRQAEIMAKLFSFNESADTLLRRAGFVVPEEE